jgi:hypothetical protein
MKIFLNTFLIDRFLFSKFILVFGPGHSLLLLYYSHWLAREGVLFPSFLTYPSF